MILRETSVKKQVVSAPADFSKSQTRLSSPPLKLSPEETKVPSTPTGLSLHLSDISLSMTTQTQKVPENNEMKTLAEDILYVIFLKMDLHTLFACESTCQRWKGILKDQSIWLCSICRETASGKAPAYKLHLENSWRDVAKTFLRAVKYWPTFGVPFEPSDEPLKIQQEFETVEAEPMYGALSEISSHILDVSDAFIDIEQNGFDLCAEYLDHAKAFVNIQFEDPSLANHFFIVDPMENKILAKRKEMLSCSPFAGFRTDVIMLPINVGSTNFVSAKNIDKMGNINIDHRDMFDVFGDQLLVAKTMATTDDPEPKSFTHLQSYLLSSNPTLQWTIQLEKPFTARSDDLPFVSSNLSEIFVCHEEFSESSSISRYYTLLFDFKTGKKLTAGELGPIFDDELFENVSLTRFHAVISRRRSDGSESERGQFVTILSLKELSVLHHLDLTVYGSIPQGPISFTVSQTDECTWCIFGMSNEACLLYGDGKRIRKRWEHLHRSDCGFWVWLMDSAGNPELVLWGIEKELLDI